MVVRAIATLDGFTQAISTHTYLFISQVGVSTTSPWPRLASPLRDRRRFSPIHAMDYGLDPQRDRRPTYLLVDAFEAIPSISLSTELEHLFDEDSGIYVNPMEHGAEWERPASLEIIDPNNTHEVQAGMGLRIRGGWSRHYNNPKHAFRFFFRSEYGDAKLSFALFEDEGANEFDKVDLRTAQNYSWSFKSTAGQENTFLRDVFSRDLQLSLGQPATRSRYYHLWINGVYWGLYRPRRAEARFAETYFGGELTTTTW